MTDVRPVDATCQRCGMPNPNHPDAADNGGVSLHNGVCVVCRAYKSEYGFYPDTNQQTLTEP